MQGTFGKGFKNSYEDFNGIEAENNLLSIEDETLRNEIKGKLVLNANRKNSSLACSVQ